MFKQNVKKKEQKQINEVQKKKTNKENYGVCFHAEKNGMCTGKKNAKSKYTQKIHRITKYRIYRIWFWVSEMLQKFIIVYLYHVGGVSLVSI